MGHLHGELCINTINKFDKTLTNNTEEKLFERAYIYKCYKLVNTLSRIFDRIEA